MFDFFAMAIAIVALIVARKTFNQAAMLRSRLSGRSRGSGLSRNSGRSGDSIRSRGSGRSRGSDGLSRPSMGGVRLCTGMMVDSRSSEFPEAWLERRVDHHQMAAIATTPRPVSIQRNSANLRSLVAYIAAMRTASSTSTATKRETPGSFCVTPTNCEAISMVVLLCVMKMN